MDFQFSQDDLSIQATVADFAQKEIAPHANDWDQHKIFPVAVLRQAATLGLGGMYVREDIGGSNLSRLTTALIFETLAEACVSTAAYVSIHNMVAWLIDQYGNQAQREQWLPDMLSMKKFGSYCLTEPNAGSDAASLRTTAVIEGDHYRINGSKAFISGGGASDIYACMVRTTEDGSHGISCIIVEKDTPGVTFGKQELKLGWNSQPTSMVFFENCLVPVRNRLSSEGMGFKIAMQALNGGRVNIGACSLGGAKACFKLAKQYMQEREQFQHKLQDFQALQFKLADMLTEFEAARLMIYRAANDLDHQTSNASLHCAMAKRFATDVGFKVSNEAMQIFGGYGYLKDYSLERFFRDLRVHQILEGTNEIMRVVIARHIFNDIWE